MNGNDRGLILDFLRLNVLATISTVNPKTLQPESALIAYCELENLEILFLTLVGSRKHENILINNKVALVIGWDINNWETLQYEGFASLVGLKDETKYQKIFQNKKNTPCREEFFQKSGMKLCKITPTWIGLSRFPKGRKPQVIEVKF